MNGNELIENSMKLIESIKDPDNINNIIDELIEPFTDYTETFGELIKPIKAILAIRNIAIRRRFKAFLISYAAEFENIDAKERHCLEMYLKKDKNIEFISDTINMSTTSRSKICSSLLGYYAGFILSNRKIITYNDYSIVNALNHIIDDDLIYFCEMCEIAFSDEERQFHQFLLSDRNYFTEVQEAMYSYTADKLTNLQMFGNPFSGPFISGGGNTIRVTELTREFYMLVKKSVDSIR